MLICQTFRFRIYLTIEAIARLDAWSDALRFLWNLANEQRLLGLAKRQIRSFAKALHPKKSTKQIRREVDEFLRAQGRL